VRFGRASHIFPDHLVLEGATLSVAFMGYVWSYGEVRGGECHGTRDWRTSNSDYLNLCVDEELSLSSGIRSSGM
jgi:hypothetical protein